MERTQTKMKSHFLNPFLVGLILFSIQSAYGESPEAIELNTEGIRHLNKADYSLAISKFKKALVIDPSNETTKGNLCKAYEGLGLTQRKAYKLDDAINSYSEAIAIEPTAHLYVMLGQAQQASKKTKEAIKNFEKAIDLSPRDTEALNALVAGWEAELQVNPISAENHLELGKALHRRGDLKAAIFEYKQAIRFSPDRTNPLAEKLITQISKDGKVSGQTIQELTRKGQN